MQPSNGYKLQLPENFIAGTIVADPPWPLDQENTQNKRRRIHYQRMSIAEICSIPVHLVAHPDAHLWLWSTNPHLEKAFEVMHAWGFNYKTMATWVKTKIGLGWWLRSRTEQLLFAARTDNLRHNPGSFTTEIRGKYRGHSVKPDEAYAMIEALSPPPYLELFANPEAEPRENWFRLSQMISPTDAFGQDHLRMKSGVLPDPPDGIVRGVGGLEIVPGQQYVRLEKIMVAKPVVVKQQKGRRVQVEFIAKKKPREVKWVTIDSLRPQDHQL